MTRAVGLAVLGALALGCGSAAGGGTSGGLKGRVMRGPTMPVCRVGVPCEEPARGVKLVFTRAGKVVGRTTTNQKGYYRIALRSGPYSVRTDRRGAEKTPSPSRITVPSDRFKRVVFHIDTGIR
jgi:hypothetical protein